MRSRARSPRSMTATAPVTGPGARDRATATEEGGGQEALIEGMGKVFMSLGYPRMAGRLLGALMLSGEEDETLESLSARAGASAGTVSTMTRLLIADGLVSRNGRDGDRRSFYRITADPWGALLERRLTPLTELAALADTAEAAAGTAEGHGAIHLHSVERFATFVDDAVDDLRDRWAAHASRAVPPAGHDDDAQTDGEATPA